MKTQYDETTIEESESGILRIYGRNEGGEWEGIGSTSSKSEAVDIAMDWGKTLITTKPNQTKQDKMNYYYGINYPLTKNQAIQRARREVSPLSPVGGGFTFTVWYPEYNAWLNMGTRNYHAATARRAQALIDHAREALGQDPVQYDGGRWTDYVDRLDPAQIEPEPPLFELPDAEFEAGGRITELCRAAGHDESGRVVVNNLRAWSLTEAEFAKLLTGGEPHSA
jgi:hypothetical protein